MTTTIKYVTEMTEEEIDNTDFDNNRELLFNAYSEITEAMSKLGSKLSPTENTLFNSLKRRGIKLSDKKFKTYAEQFKSFAEHVSGKKIKDQVNY